MSVTIDDFVLEYNNFLTPEECMGYIDCYHRYESMGLTINRQASGEPSVRKADDQMFVTSLLATNELNISDLEPFDYFVKKFWDQAYPLYRQKYGVLTDVSQHTIRLLKIQKTHKSEGYHVWHCEDGNPSVMRRLMTFILYLNDIPDGGETEFLYYSKRYKAEAGKLILWPAGYTHTHRGNPPLSNTKYILTGWVELS